MKYNFELILSDEVMKANRLKTLEQDKDKRNTKIALFIAIISVLIILLIAIDNNNYKEEDLSKCENGTIQIMTARKYDNQIETFCK